MIRSYFDGGNQPSGRDGEGREYDIVTLAAFVGLADHWRVFESGWRKVLKHHRAPYLHTTDTVGLCNPFSRNAGWSEDKVNRFIADCVTVIETTSAISNLRIGLRPITVSIILKGFRKALKENPDLDSPAHVLTSQGVGLAFQYGDYIGGRTFELVFDRGEPFHGHAYDRWTNPRSKKVDKIWERVIQVGEADMRKVPALQAADLFAWSLNHAHQDRELRYEWQQRLLLMEREKEWYDYEELKNPLWESIERIKAFRLPKRRTFK